jgi:hypothetical protein
VGEDSHISPAVAWCFSKSLTACDDTFVRKKNDLSPRTKPAAAIFSVYYRHLELESNWLNIR